MRKTLSILAMLVAPLVHAESLQIQEEAKAPRNFVNLRGGATSFNAEHPEICLEGGPLSFLSLEACGTGSGFLHRDPDPEIAHFRARYHFDGMDARIGWLQPNVALGFAELQVGEDAAGFQFTGTGPMQTETAGAEAGAGVRLLVPLQNGVEAIVDLSASLSWLPAAPQLVRSMSPWQPTASLTVGVGF